MLTFIIVWNIFYVKVWSYLRFRPVPSIVILKIQIPALCERFQGISWDLGIWRFIIHEVENKNKLFLMKISFEFFVIL